MIISNVYSEIPSKVGPPRNVQFARFEKRDDEYYMRLKGFRFGQFASLPLGDTLEYIKGQLVYEVRPWGAKENITVDCGFVYSESSQKGHIYIGRLYLDPWPSVILSKSETYRHGVCLKVIDA